MSSPLSTPFPPPLLLLLLPLPLPLLLIVSLPLLLLLLTLLALVISGSLFFFFCCRRQAAHWSVICQAMEGHVRRALSSGWSLPSLKDLNDPDMSMKVGTVGVCRSLHKPQCSRFICSWLSLKSPSRHYGP